MIAPVSPHGDPTPAGPAPVLGAIRAGGRNRSRPVRRAPVLGAIRAGGRNRSRRVRGRGPGALAVVAAIGLVGWPAAAHAGEDARSTGAVQQVVIISIPTLTWQAVADGGLPELSSLLERSAAALLSQRTIGPGTTLGEAYVTMGSGNRATVKEDLEAFGLPPDAPFEDHTAGEEYRERTGTDPGDVAAVHLAIESVKDTADDQLYGSEPGILGQTLADAGLGAAVVANAGDLASPGGQAALALMDRAGRVAAGDLSDGLVVEDPARPTGTRLDEPALFAATDEALRSQDVVLVEASDLDRVDRARDADGRPVGEVDPVAAAAADRLVGHVADRVDLERTLLLVVGASAPRGPEHLGVFAIAGPGVEPGQARSATTRRAGYVTLPDIAPTVLDSLGLTPPDAMNGTPITSVGGGVPDAALFEHYAARNEISMFRDRAVGPVSVVFIVFLVLVCGAAAFSLSTGRTGLHPVVAAAALVVLAMPPLVFLSGLVRYDRLGLVGYTLALLTAAAVLALVAWRMFRRWLLGPALALTGLTVAVLVGDVVTGANLQIDTAFGYSPIVAGRFAGFGNLAFALLAMAALVTGTAGWNVAGASRSARAIGAVAGFFAIVLMADGWPTWGSDVGGVLAMLPAFTVTVALLAGWRIGWRRVVLIGAATIAVLGAFAAFDLSRPEEDRTHLGRFVQRLADGDVGPILQRKIQANVNILTSSVWTWLIPVGFAFLAYLVWRRAGVLDDLQTRIPGLRAALVGAVVAGGLGFALNDSGVAVPAMMFGVLLPYLAHLVVRTSEPAP